MNGMREKLFSNSEKTGFSEQLIKGEGDFSDLLDRARIESHDTNSHNTIWYRSNLRQMLLKHDTNAWFIDDHLTK